MSDIDKLLSQLHEDLARRLVAVVNDPEAKASDLNVVRQFLRDNNIDAVPRDGSPLGDLIDALPEDFKKSFN